MNQKHVPSIARALVVIKMSQRFLRSIAVLGFFSERNGVQLFYKKYRLSWVRMHLLALLLLTVNGPIYAQGSEQIYSCRSGGTGTAQQCQQRDAQAQSGGQNAEQIYSCRSGGTGTAQQCQQRDAQAQSGGQNAQQIYSCRSGGTGTAADCSARDLQSSGQSPKWGGQPTAPQTYIGTPDSNVRAVTRPNQFQAIDWNSPMPRLEIPDPPFLAKEACPHIVKVLPWAIGTVVPEIYLGFKVLKRVVNPVLGTVAITFCPK